MLLASQSFTSWSWLAETNMCSEWGAQATALTQPVWEVNTAFTRLPSCTARMSVLYSEKGAVYLRAGVVQPDAAVRPAGQQGAAGLAVAHSEESLVPHQLTLHAVQ